MCINWSGWVCRVLNRLDDAGIVTRHNFEGGHSVFELTQQPPRSPDLPQLTVIEFSDDSIEARSGNCRKTWHSPD
ncbi:transcriptional repressor [Escherichia coli]